MQYASLSARFETVMTTLKPARNVRLKVEFFTVALNTLWYGKEKKLTVEGNQDCKQKSK